MGSLPVMLKSDTPRTSNLFRPQCGPYVSVYTCGLWLSDVLDEGLKSCCASSGFEFPMLLGVSAGLRFSASEETMHGVGFGMLARGV